MMDYNQLEKMIKRHEGLRLEVYEDSVGVLTCGYGHALHAGSEVPIYVAESFFHVDFRKAVEDYERTELELDTVRRAVIIDMIFNLGYKGLLKFKKMLKAIKEGNYDQAAVEMRYSKWHKQVGIRALELERMMETGMEV